MFPWSAFLVLFILLMFKWALPQAQVSMQETNKRFFSSSFLSLLLRLPLTSFPFYPSQSPTHSPSPTDSSLTHFFFCPTAQFLFLSSLPSLLNHTGFYTGIELSVEHHQAVTSALPQFSFPYCLFPSTSTTHLTLRIREVTEHQREKAQEGPRKQPFQQLWRQASADGEDWAQESTAQNLASPERNRPEGQLTLDCGHGSSSALFRWVVWRPYVVHTPLLRRLW